MTTVKKLVPYGLWIIIFFIILYVIAEIVFIRYIIIHQDTDFYNPLMNSQIAIFSLSLLTVICLILIFGLYNGFPWARYATIIFFSIMLVISISSFLFIPDIFSIVILSCGLILLYRPAVKKYFSK